MPSYQGTVDRFEEKLAVIKLNDGTEVLWPVKNLADEITAGSKVQITISDNLNGQKEKEAMAKTLLNEILNVTKQQQNL